MKEDKYQFTEKGNKGEDFVNSVLIKSFLKHWVYINPKDEDGNKKELCDALIIFRDSIIIISVKNYNFSGKYERYFKRTIGKAVKQICGVERKLFNNDIQLLNPQGEKIIFPKKKIKNISRLIINLGEDVRFYPSNKETKSDKFVTILDKYSFQTITRGLDTIPDFIDYLTKREEVFIDKNVVILPKDEFDWNEKDSQQYHKYCQENLNFLQQGSIIISGTECDLLAKFLEFNRKFPNQISDKNYNGIYAVMDGAWEDFLARDQVKKKRELDKNSYFIDQLVDSNLSEKPNKNFKILSEELLSNNRFERRNLSNVFLDFYRTYNGEQHPEFYARRYMKMKNTGYIFFYFSPNMDEEMINGLIQIAIDAYSVHCNYECSKMILIATTMNFKTFKFGYDPEIKRLSKKDEEGVKNNIRILKWFTQHTQHKISEREYPAKSKRINKRSL